MKQTTKTQRLVALHTLVTAYTREAHEQNLEFLVFGILYAARNNNAHGNVASRVNSIFSDNRSIVAATWIFLFGYFYLSLILVSLRAIDMDDLHIHALNVSLSGPQ
ncbi:hypothetical protein GZ982_25715 [Pseudomonas fluorescens]|nr:hypothetical protein GZ982_25715 [Pseudomonas fluorescens]